MQKFITPVLLLISLGTFAQDSFIKTLTADLNNHEAKELKEKIYLQTDKSFYISGEICWFKSYVVDASTNKPFTLSKVGYVELLNRDLKPVLQGKILLQDGIGNGSFFIPLYLPSGSYKIRAYTNWMKNFSPEYFFEKDITVVNTMKRDRDSLLQKASAFDIQFFPEGGNLVDGASSVVGFKAVDENGKGINVEGDIVDQDKKIIAHFQSQLFGMGRFEMVATAGKEYKAYVRFASNQLTVANFPAIKPKGYTLKVISDQNSLTISTVSNYVDDDRPLYLLIHTRGIVKYANLLPLDHGKGHVTIPFSTLGEGISNITLFAANQQAVCERLVYRMPSNLDISAQSEMEEYQTRKKITANIHIHNKPADSTITNSLGVSVFRVDSLQTDASPDIRSYLYLSSDIKGIIEHPEYYFTHTGDQAVSAIENLMLTQGWRRFKWDDVWQAKSSDFDYVPEWTGHIVSAKISDRISGIPLANQTVYLAGPAIKSQLAGCISNKKGQLLFDLPHLLGSNVVVLQTENRTDSNYKLDVANPFSEKYPSSYFPPLKMNAMLKEDLQFYNIGTQVQNVYLLSNLIKFKSPRYSDSTSFYGEPDKKFFLDDYTRFGTMEEVVREYVTGVSVHRSRERYSFRIMNDPQKLYFDQDPLIVLDGVPIFDASEVMRLDPLRIKKIEIVNRKYFLGSLVASGIFALYSYNNDMAGLQINSHALILEYEGLQLQREFYSPKYNVAQKDAKRLPDFRNVLCWEPNIVIGKSGEAQISFYSSDRKGKYMGVVEGLSQGGVAGSTQFFFEVQ